MRTCMQNYQLFSVLSLFLLFTLSLSPSFAFLFRECKASARMLDFILGRIHTHIHTHLQKSEFAHTHTRTQAAVFIKSYSLKNAYLHALNTDTLQQYTISLFLSFVSILLPLSLHLSTSLFSQ